MITFKRLAITLFTLLSLAFTTVSAKAQDIVDTAIAAGQFETLVAAVQAAGLVEVLKGDGPFTVFAPTDEAFAALPPGTVDNLLKPKNKDQLAAVLTYHVVPGKIMSADIAGKTAEVRRAAGARTEVHEAEILECSGLEHLSFKGMGECVVGRTIVGEKEGRRKSARMFVATAH